MKLNWNFQKGGRAGGGGGVGGYVFFFWNITFKGTPLGVGGGGGEVAIRILTERRASRIASSLEFLFCNTCFGVRALCVKTVYHII